MCDVITIDQRLKSGAEFDQFGVRGLRGRKDSGGYRGSNSAARGDGQEVPPRLVDGRVDFGRSFSWRAMHAVSLGHLESPFVTGVRAGAEESSLPPGLLLW